MMVEEDSDSPDLAVDKVIDVRLRLRHGNAAHASGGAGLHGGKYLVVADRLQVLEVDVKVRGSVRDVGKEAPDPLRAFIDTREDLIGTQLHIRGAARGSPSRSRALSAATARRTTSRFSCDIAYVSRSGVVGPFGHRARSIPASTARRQSAAAESARRRACEGYPQKSEFGCVSTSLLLFVSMKKGRLSSSDL